MAALVHSSSSIISDGSQLRNALNTNGPPLPTLSQGLPPQTIEYEVDIDSMIDKYSLNTEQVWAFSMISEHSLDQKNEQLRMYLGGAGGTGKSCVINALREFFICRGQE